MTTNIFKFHEIELTNGGKMLIKIEDIKCLEETEEGWLYILLTKGRKYSIKKESYRPLHRLLSSLKNIN